MPHIEIEQGPPGIRGLMAFRPATAKPLPGIPHQSTSWLCHFQKGDGNVEFDQTLRALLLFASEHHSFLHRFVEEEGTVEVVLNSKVPFDQGKLFDLSLDPLFLGELSQLRIRLRVQVWSA